jgi:hypothetical protein
MITNVKVQRFNSARGYIFIINVSGGTMDRILNMLSSYTGKSWVSAVAKAMIANVKVARLYSTQGYSFILIVSEGTMDQIVNILIFLHWKKLDWCCASFFSLIFRKVGWIGQIKSILNEFIMKSVNLALNYKEIKYMSIAQLENNQVQG